MEQKQIKLPKLKIITTGSRKDKFLYRVRDDSGKSNVNLTFQKDEVDPRVISIKYQEQDIQKDNSILYYSEAFNKHTIITGNLRYNYDGRIVVKDFNGHKLGVSLEHLSQNFGIKKNHIERINKIDGIRRDLTLDYVVKRCESIFYSLPEFLGK